MRCDSCDRDLPEDGIICPSCNDAEPEPAAGYKELRHEARSLRGWIIISLVFGIFAAPFAIWRATRSLARFRGKAQEEDPVSYRQLRVMRGLAVALLALWVVLLAGHFGFQWQISEPEEARLLEPVVADLLAECSCPADKIFFAGVASQPGVIEHLSRGRRVGSQAEPWPQADTRVMVRVGTPQYFGEDKATVAAQLDAPSPLTSLGANYMLRRDAEGRWIVYHRSVAWKS